MSRKRAATIITAGLAFMAVPGAHAAPPAKSRPPTAADFAALKQRVDEQSELINKLTQVESDHYQMLIKLIQSLRPGAPIVLPPSAPAQASPPVGHADTSPSVPPPSPASPDVHHAVASITGRVEVKGKAAGPVFVYVDNIKEPAVDRSVEITQKDRAFVPSTLVVQKGTRVSFPNADPFLHNVFSPSATTPFDLGSYRHGEPAGVVRLFKPGVVEVLCNMHAKMRANVLVVPNRYHVKAGADGSFRLDNIPVGARQVVAWTPDAKPITESVTLTPAGASVNFALQVEAVPPPLDKLGKPRPAYRQEE
jgi:plastocyanin